MATDVKTNITAGTDSKYGTAKPYTLPAATASTLGGVKVGSGLAVTSDGTLSSSGGESNVFSAKLTVNDNTFTSETTYSEFVAAAIAGKTILLDVDKEILGHIFHCTYVGSYYSVSNCLLFTDPNIISVRGSGSVSFKKYKYKLAQDGTWSVSDKSLDIYQLGSEFEQNSDKNIRLKDGGITSAKLANGAVTAAKVADGAITAGKIADGAITSDKLASGVGGGGNINLQYGEDTFTSRTYTNNFGYWHIAITGTTSTTGSVPTTGFGLVYCENYIQLLSLVSSLHSKTDQITVTITYNLNDVTITSTAAGMAGPAIWTSGTSVVGASSVVGYTYGNKKRVDFTFSCPTTISDNKYISTGGCIVCKE